MNHELPSFRIDAGELLQHVSRVVYRGSPLHYGYSGTNRYDDPARDYGVLYPLRNNYPAKSIALFERAGAKVTVIEDIDLVDHVDWLRFVATYRIGIAPDSGPVEPDDEAS